MEFYHVSSPLNRNKILKEGLKPKIGASYIAHYEEKNMGPVVFVSIENNYDSTYDDDRFIINLSKSEYEKLEFKVDAETENGFYTKFPINKEKISLIYEGTGESTF